jgi:hypothetical protein
MDAAITPHSTVYVRSANQTHTKVPLFVSLFLLIQFTSTIR